jgi:hypothetical protein
VSHYNASVTKQWNGNHLCHITMQLAIAQFQCPIKNKSPFGYVCAQQMSHFGATGHELETSFAFHIAQGWVRK